MGYFHPRYAEGILDELEINALALSAGEDKVVLMSADLCEMGKKAHDRICQGVCKATSLTEHQIFIHCTHTHTGPVVSMDGVNDLGVSGQDEQGRELVREYGQLLCRKFADAAVMALADLKAAQGWDLVLPCCLTNGCEGYFPMQDAYDEGGYEARSSHYKAGTAERLIAEGVKLLDSLR